VNEVTRLLSVVNGDANYPSQVHETRARTHHRAERLHSRKDCSGTWDAMRFVVDFRAAPRQADGGRASGRKASGYARPAGGRSSEGRTV